MYKLFGKYVCLLQRVLGTQRRPSSIGQCDKNDLSGGINGDWYPLVHCNWRPVSLIV